MFAILWAFKAMVVNDCNFNLKKNGDFGGSTLRNIGENNNKCNL
jgi:hypothetical protein